MLVYGSGWEDCLDKSTRHLNIFRYFLIFDLWRLWCSIRLSYRKQIYESLNGETFNIYAGEFPFQLFDDYSKFITGFYNRGIDWNTFMTYEIIHNLYYEIIYYAYFDAGQVGEYKGYGRDDAIARRHLLLKGKERRLKEQKGEQGHGRPER